MKTLGVDCAKVILYPVVGVVPDSFESLGTIVRSGAFESVHIVSRASLFTRVYFLFRLHSAGFWKKTGIPRENIHFCFRNREKIDICRKIRIRHFIDDRLPVLERMESLERRFAFNPTDKESREYPDTLARSTVVHSWKELMPLLLDA